LAKTKPNEGGFIMRLYFLAVLMTGALVMSSASFAGQNKSGSPRIDWAVVEFPDQVKLLNVILKGEYLFVHDEEKMAAGQDCTYVYSHDKGKQGKLIVSFHCEPVQREKANRFTVIVERRALLDLRELVEYRFAGENEGHRVPKA
jgi:hypothetical protein